MSAVRYAYSKLSIYTTKPKYYSGPTEHSKLIVTPSCTVVSPIIGTRRGAVIIATSTNYQDASLYDVGGNNVLECGQASCKTSLGLAIMYL